MRNLIRVASTFMCVAAMTTILSRGAKADFYNRMSTITFSGPVEIPGVHLKGYAVLPAGTYVFKLMDSTSNRHIVQIFTADQKKCLATILAIPDTRVHLTDKTVITFRERPNGEPPALRTWFYPDAAWGDEFVYSKKEAKEIAETTKTPVLFNNSQPEAPAEATAPIQAPKPAEVQKMNQAEVKAYSPAGEELELSQVVTTPPPSSTQPSSTPAPTPAQLPKTASQLGLIMLTGLLSLTGGLTARLARQYCR